MVRREYHASATDRGLQAPNQAQGFHSWFTPAGVNVVNRDSADSLVRLELESWVRGRRLAQAGEGEVKHIEAQVEIVRPDLVEWYENRPEGLEHDFTVALSATNHVDALLLRPFLSESKL